MSYYSYYIIYSQCHSPGPRDHARYADHPGPGAGAREHDAAEGAQGPCLVFDDIMCDRTNILIMMVQTI